MVKKCRIALLLVIGSLMALPAAAQAVSAPARVSSERPQTCVIAPGPTESKPAVGSRLEVEIGGVAYWQTDTIQIVSSKVTIFRNPQGVCKGPHSVIYRATAYVTESLVPVANPGAKPVVRVMPVPLPAAALPKAPKAPSGKKRNYGPVRVTEPVEPVTYTEGGGG